MRKEDCGTKVPHRKATRDVYMLSTKPDLSFVGCAGQCAKCRQANGEIHFGATFVETEDAMTEDVTIWHPLTLSVFGAD